MSPRRGDSERREGRRRPDAVSVRYGRWVPNADTTHKPCSAFAERGKSLLELRDEQAARVSRPARAIGPEHVRSPPRVIEHTVVTAQVAAERERFEATKKATEEAAARRNARNHTTKHGQKVHGTSSRQIRSIIEIFD